MDPITWRPTSVLSRSKQAPPTSSPVKEVEESGSLGPESSVLMDPGYITLTESESARSAEQVKARWSHS